MIRILCLLLLAVPALADDKPVEFVFEDQFETKQQMKDLHGIVVVLVYGDRKASDECKTLGAQIHLTFHPDAKDLPPAKAKLVKATELPNLPAGKQSPGVVVQPVACCDTMPAAMRPVLRHMLAKAAPDVPVWLDFDGTMTQHFGLTAGQANITVFDVEGRYRHGISGTPDAKKLSELQEIIQKLRLEGVSR